MIKYITSVRVKEHTRPTKLPTTGTVRAVLRASWPPA